MKILHVAVEVAPFVSVGGLSQVMYFLPKFQAKAGLEVTVFTPLHGASHKSANQKKIVVNNLSVSTLDPHEHEDFVATPSSAVSELWQDKVRVLFLENNEFFGMRQSIFGYLDDHVRFCYFSNAVLEFLLLCKARGNDEYMPDVIHCHDWHTGYLIDLIKRNPRYSKILADIKVVYTVHNFAYQGNYDFKYSIGTVDDGKKPLYDLTDTRLQMQNALLRGIQNCDGLSTVSPTHAKEVLTTEYGEGLETFLQSQKQKLIGIMNGLDFNEFDPHTDTNISTNYTSESFVEQRLKNKLDLQSEFGLPRDPHKFLIGYVGRIAPQKGWDLVLEVLPNLFKEKPDFNMVVLGSGDDHYCQTLVRLKKQFPRQLGVKIISNFKLPRKIFAGADCMLIASSFEPGGIVAFEAMRYGAVPVIRHTGGLGDAVATFHSQTGKGCGFSFISKTPWALYGAIIEASTYFTEKKIWHKIVKNCLKVQSSWEHVAKKYKAWYTLVIHT